MGVIGIVSKLLYRCSDSFGYKLAAELFPLSYNDQSQERLLYRQLFRPLTF